VSVVVICRCPFVLCWAAARAPPGTTADSDADGESEERGGEDTTTRTLVRESLDDGVALTRTQYIATNARSDGIEK
jgi:hypothetical protein